MIRTTIITSVIQLLMAGSLCAQDGHYWTQQYGTKSMLLSGSVIGGVEDLGAVYYNPARLSVIANPAFLLSASVYEYNKLSISDAFGSSTSAAKAEIRGVPSLAAGTFKLKFLPNHFFAYAIMSRQLSDLSTSYRNEVTQDVFTTLPGNEIFSGELGYTYKGNEQWIGLTWSHPISKKLSVGVTTNLVSNNQTKGSKIALRALSQANEVAVYEYIRSYTYQETGLLWKLGLAGTFGKWNLGLTVKTPVLNLSGSGSYMYEEFYSTIPGLATLPESFTTSYQEGLPITLTAPLAVGFGASRSIGKSKIHFSTEWYSAVSKYNVMNATRHTSQSNPANSYGFILTDELKSVWNSGFGLEFYIGEHVSGYGSFSTDFSAVTNDITRFVQRLDETSNNSWQADFYHLGGGVVLDLKGAAITLGITHTGSKQTVPRLLNFPDGSGKPIFDPTTSSNLEWDRYRLVFSFSMPFLAKYTDKLEAK